MTAPTFEETLEHYGVKGMKWGVRRSDEELRKAASGSGKKAAKAAKKLEKRDEKWEKDSRSMKKFVEINNKMADRLNGPDGEFAKLNNNPKYKGKEFDDYSEGIGKEYLTDVRKTYNRVLSDIADETPGSPSGKYKAEFFVTEDSFFPSMVIVPAGEAKHAEGDLVVELEWDEKTGKVVKIGGLSILEHSDFYDTLEHYGIKGMRWGVRRSKKEISKDNAKRAKEGKEVTPSKEAKAAKAAAAKAKKHGLDALSNDELNQLNKRMNLERNYDQLMKDQSKREKGKSIVGKTLAAGATVNSVIAFSRSPVGKAIRDVVESEIRSTVMLPLPKG